MALADPPRLLTASPTVEVNGMSYPLIASNLQRMRMTESLGGLSSLELTMTDSANQGDGGVAHASGAGSPLQLGAGVRVFAGPVEDLATEIFDGQITAIESEVQEAAEPLFTILAEDRLFPLRRKRRTRLFENMDLAALVGAVATDHKLKPEVRDGVDKVSRQWMQADETDLGFLRRILETLDCDMQVVGDRLQVGRIGMNQRSAVTLVGQELRYVRVTADIAEQVSTTRVASFDPKAGEATNAKEKAGGFGPGEGQTGAEILAEKFSAVDIHLGRYGPMTDADATAFAKYESNRRARAFVRCVGTGKGNAQLRVGTWITLAGVNPQFENVYAVTKAVHRYDQVDGYLTDFEAECAHLGKAK
jgi:phage protein D